jgi:hypothetical protein
MVDLAGFRVRRLASPAGAIASKSENSFSSGFPRALLFGRNTDFIRPPYATCAWAMCFSVFRLLLTAGPGKIVDREADSSYPFRMSCIPSALRPKGQRSIFNIEY